MKIIGFINPNMHYPSAIVTVIDIGKQDKVNFVYPTCETHEVRITTQEKSQLQKVIGYDFVEGAYAYAIGPDNIKYGLHHEILAYLRQLASYKVIDDEFKEYLLQYITANDIETVTENKLIDITSQP